MTAHLNPLPGLVSVRAPERERLASLIRVEQSRSSELRFTADELRRQVADFQKAREPGAVRAVGRARRPCGSGWAWWRPRGRGWS